MAKVFAPFMSIAASGSVGGVLTARNNPYGQVMSRKPRSRQPVSTRQLVEQAKMRDAAALYAALSDNHKKLWGYWAERTHVSPWVAFWTEFQAQNITAPDVPQIPSTWLYA
jgi:hypothetical protein